MEETPVQFSLEELWLLQSRVRHELAEVDRWHSPPVSLSLNQQIASGIVFCDETKAGEATLLLSLGDCLCIDFNVSQADRSPAGVGIGRSILLKTFRTRRTLAGEDLPDADEPAHLRGIRAADVAAKFFAVPDEAVTCPEEDQ